MNPSIWANPVASWRKSFFLRRKAMGQPVRTSNSETTSHEAEAPGQGCQSKGDVLFVSRQRIIGRTNGSSAYLLDLAAAVRQAGFTPHLLQPSPDLMGRWPFMRLRSEMAVFQTHAVRGVIKIGSVIITRDFGVAVDALRAVASRVAKRLGLPGEWLHDRPRPYAVSAPWSARDHAFVRRHAVARADIVIADYVFQTDALAHMPDAPSAIVMHDLFHTREAGAAGRDSVAHLDRDTEIAMLSRADAVIAIQSAEAQFVGDHVAATSLLTPMAAHPVKQPQLGERHRLLFVGSNTAPNVVGLEWLFTHVWPELKQRAPQITLDVAGSVASAFPAGGPAGVTFHGMVDRLDPFYMHAGIVISPLTFGSGLKIKLIEALAHGKSIVATSVTLQGVERECEGSVVRADTPQEFVEGVLALTDDMRRGALAAAALDTARQQFSAQVCNAQFTAWLERHRPLGTRSDHAGDAV